MGEETIAPGGFEFGILGPLMVSRNGRFLPLRGPQERALLALLVCDADRVVTHARIVDALWGESPQRGALTSIQTHVSHLRQVLEPNRPHGVPARVLVTQGGGYRLAVPASAVDSTRFEDGAAGAAAELERGDAAEAIRKFDSALSLWRGDVLVDLPGYAFVEQIATRLNDIRVSAEEGRIQALLDLGRLGMALAEVDRLLALHSLREGLYAQRMLALYRAGRQSEALATYRSLQSHLNTQLGIAPNYRLQELQRRILLQDPDLAGRPQALTRVEVAPRPELPGRSEDGASEPTDPGPGVLSTTEPAEVSPTPKRRLWDPRRARRLLAAVGACLAVALVLLGSRPPPTAIRIAEGNTVTVLDSDGAVVDGVAAGINPSALAHAGGFLWVANQGDGTVMRIDPRTVTVAQRFDVGHDPDAIVGTADDVWVANFGDATVTRINIAADKVVQAAIPVGTRPAALAAWAGGVWVANSGDNTVQRIDVTTGQPGKAVDVGDGPNGLLIDGNTLWVANGRDGTLSHLDAASGSELSSPVDVGAGPRGLVRFGDEVWVADQLSKTVTRVDVATGRTREVNVGDGPTSLAQLDDAVWVSDQYAMSLSRIEPATEQVTPVPMGGSPRHVLSVGGRLWVAVGPSVSDTHRGGTLTVAAALLPGFGTNGVDPAAVYTITTAWPERLVYQGLVSLRYSSEDSQSLVPNLATRIPRPSEGGRTYTFELRRGVRYSTGAEVRATDFVRGVGRALTRGQGTMFAGILGAQVCIKDPANCDLTDGVEADDASGRVSFHLTAPDPDFLYKLTLFVFPTPVGEYDMARPPPGTGPYRIESYTRYVSFVLARNPYFTEPWSVAAAPAGYPDVIRWLKVPDVKAAVAAVDAGAADLAELSPLDDRSQTRDLAADLAVRRPAQLHSGPPVGTTFVVLNSSRPPFDNLKAREAVNLAVDRRAMVDIVGGPLAAEPSCQIVIPGFPGYAPYCPHTTDSGDGAWHGPDVAAARRLVEESGTSGAHVTVTDVVGDINPPFEAYIAQVLRDLGYDVSLQLLPDSDANQAYFYNPSSPIQVQSGGWLPDYPRPSTFYDPLVRCPGADHHQEYVFGYCSKQDDQDADAALALQAIDPGRSLRAWSAVQRHVVDNAPLVVAAATKDVWYTSPRVGNYQQSAIYGPLFSQVWVQ
jgi:ABC-type transport system substrate-binding protein/DNA-binding SARP family transcriptional activator